MAGSKNKKGRNLILLLLLMVVMIGALIWLMKYNDKKENSKTDTGDEATVIATADTDQISTIHFKLPENEMTLIRNEEGIWMNYLDENFPVNQTYANNMANAFASISATRTITEGIEDLSEFGLDDSAAAISATLKDGSAITIKLGSQVPVTGGYYAVLNNEDKVYTILDTFYTAFDYTLVQMTEVEKIPSITAENITKLSVENRDKQSFETVYDEDSPADLSGFSNYIINKPYSTPVPADTDTITTLFGNYTAMSFSSCVDYKASDLSKYGLENPSSQINIAYYEELTQDSDKADDSDSGSNNEQGVTKVNHELTLLIGGTDENGNYYAKLSDSSAVHTITESTVSTLTDINAYDNTYKYINLINIDAANSMDIEADGTAYQLTIKRSKETVDGKETETAKYYINDKEMEESAFKALYQVIIGPVTEREISQEEGTSSKVPYMTVTYHLITTDTPLVIKYLPYDQNYYAVNTDGAQYFLTDIRKIADITNSLKAAK